jgi:saccharopine dehydrogenase (NAD+, L-lysine-forming)
MRTELPWLIYGATGTTGRLVVERARAHGQRPILAGRDGAAVRTLADRHKLEAAAVSLDDRASLEALLRRSSRVLHVAGPFARTAPTMLDACLATATPYLDVSGEVEAVAATLARDDAARSRGIAIIAGAGFGVTAGDCLAAHVARRYPRATRLRLGIDARNGRRSTGAAASTLDVLAGGGAWIASGRLVRGPLAHERFRAALDGRAQTFAAAPLAEALAAHHTTGIPNVVAGIPVPALAAPLMRWFGPVLRTLARRPALRRLATTRRRVGADAGPPRAEPTPLRSRVWARAADDEGGVTSVLELGEGYAFAAEAIVQAAQGLERRPLAGAFTPAAAFGPDFVLAIPGVERRDLAADDVNP